MTDQPRSIKDVLMDRLKATQDIAAANTEQLRLNQMASGLMVLDMKDERDGVVRDSQTRERSENNAALARNMEKINRLEQRLSSLDDELEDLMKKEG